MQNEDTVASGQTPAQPSPQLQPTPGLQTSSGQFTAIFTVVAMVLALVGYHFTPAQVESWTQAVNNMLVTLGPLLAIIPVLISYINSRGKVASNALTANSVVLAAQSPANTAITINKS